MHNTSETLRNTVYDRVKCSELEFCAKFGQDRDLAEVAHAHADGIRSSLAREGRDKIVLLMFIADVGGMVVPF